ncbi:MAG TPA: ParB/RepB/Spo0J family partition protein [Microthrixaceae bacterium]|nr:ParB/RepB/Spo0J family partition protein [Microthrixaceae bacterium]
MARKGGLGRGLTALIPSAEEDPGDTGTGLKELPVSAVYPNPMQPRRLFDEETLEGLVDSVREIGVLQPILVRSTESGYELIAGERRWRAAKRVGLPTIPAVVRTVDDVSSLEQALVENLHRQDLNALEEAAAYQQLIDDFGMTQDEVAKRVGKSRSAVANHLRLFQLSPAVQKLVGEGLISAGHAKALLGHPDRSYQEGLAKRVVTESLTVRQIEQMVKERLDLEAGLGAGGSSKPTDDSAGDDQGGPSKDDEQPQLRPPGLLELEELLAGHLDTRVSIAMTAKRGKVTVDFANLEDLERIYRLIMG